MVWTHEKNGTGMIAKGSYGMDLNRKKEKRKTWTWIEAVSYTHLDVYKRQIVRSIMTYGSVVWTTNKHTGTKLMTAEMKDVYKRQS